MYTLTYSPEARHAILVGYQRHWRFRVIDQAGVLNEPLYRNGWWFQALESESTIPTTGRLRLDELRKAGIKIKGLMVAHEAPKLFTPPVESKKIQEVKEVTYDYSLALETIMTVLRRVVEVSATVVTLGGIILVQAVLVDPALIVVLEDGTWLEVMTWYD